MIPSKTHYIFAYKTAHDILWEWLRFRQWQWIPAFAGMTMPGTRSLNIVIPAKAGIYCPHSGWCLNHGWDGENQRGRGLAL
jgi:hypothetical protein